MIRLLRSKRALIKELREYQTAFDALTGSFARHRRATGDRAVAQQHRIDVLEQAIDRAGAVRSGGIGIWPERIDDVIEQETQMKRRLDGLGD